MSDERRRWDLELLGLDHDANEAEILEAYHRRRALYRSGNLATYALLSSEERRQKMNALEGAVRRLTESMPRPEVLAEGSSNLTETPRFEDEQSEVGKTPSIGPEPDRETSPGAYLKHFRRARGLSLEDVTKQTKILRSRVEAVEQEDTSVLPADVYVRGFVRALAELLEIPDPDGLARTYLEKVRG